MGRRGSRTRGVVAFLVLTLLIGSAAAPAAPVVSATPGGGNASINLTKTIANVSVTPTLSLALSVDRSTAIPGDSLTYTATLANAGANLGLTGTFVAQNTSEVTATVAADYDEIEYFSIQQNAWLPLAGSATSQAGYTPVEPAPISTGLSLVATRRPIAGVTYASGSDHIVGTTINKGKTATWDYTATVALSPTQVALLLDPAKVSKIRNVVHFEITPRAAGSGQPYTFRVDFISQLRAGSGTVTNATITITPPSGAPAVFTPTTTPTLGSIPSGASRTVQSTYLVPVVAPKGDAETDADYLARLRAIDGQTLTARADASATGGGGTIAAPQQSATTTEHLPILTIDKTGPATVDAGTTITYDLGLANTGSAPASDLEITDALPGGATGTVSDVPSSLAPSAAATAHAAYYVPSNQPEGDLTDTASLTWQDANGNPYGPLSDSFTTEVLDTLAGAHLVLAPETAGPLVVGTSHTLTATATNTLGDPIPSLVVLFSVTGPNATSANVTTDASGSASFTYTGGTAGTDTAQATATKGGTTIQSNTASAVWLEPINPISTTQILARFFASDGSGIFHATPAQTPAFSQYVPTINFNPPAGTVPGLSGVGVNTRPFTDVTTDLAGNFTGRIVAEGNGLQAGVGSLDHFNAVLTGEFTVAAAGNITFDFYSDDGFIFGIANGATRVSGSLTNPPASGLTPFEGYPVVGSYNQPTSPVANTITVNFPAPGSYPYEVDYSECCGGQLVLTMALRATGHGVPPSGSLSLTPITIASKQVGQSQTMTVAAMDAGGAPLADLPVVLTITGPNDRQVEATTDSAGIATFTYTGQAPGTDQLQVGANVSGSPTISNIVSLGWTAPPTPKPEIGEVGPADGSIITEPVTITAEIAPPSGQTINSWSVTYQRVGTTGVTTIASGAGAPPATLATFDPTILPNGTYTVTISATASGGGIQTAATTLVVDGNLKLGRYVTTYQDLSVGVAGLPMQVLRTYDSFDKSVGDFGVGWRVELSNFRVSTGRPLGLGGWTQYNVQCFFGLCLTGFRTSIPHVATVTWPDGHQEIFDFTPDGGSNLFWTGTAKFSGRARATSKLAVDGSSDVSYRGDGNLYAGGFGSSTLFDPQRFRLTAKDGTVYLLDRTSGLVSSTDRNGNTLTVSATGISSSRGPSITFLRDAQGRITKVTGPEAETLLYTYDAAGDLKTVTDPNGRVVTYDYDTAHNLTLTKDPLNRPFQTLTYVDGRLATVTDALGNETTVDVDPDARTETVIDAEGRLTTLSTFDARGNVIERRDVYDGRTAITAFTYDSFDNVKTRTDPDGHTWTGLYDQQNLRFFTDPTGKTIEIRYDAFGYPIRWIQPRGGETVYGWNAAGNLESITDALSHAESYTYDGAGNRASRTDREGQTWLYTYFASGKLKTTTDPLGRVTSYTYDDSGRLLTETDPTSRMTAYTYWPDGSLKTRMAPGGLVTGYTYDELGLLKTKTDQAGKTTTWQYDSAGRVRTMIDPLGNETAYGFDGDGRLETTTAPDGGVTTSAYDGVGRSASVTDPIGRVTSYTYDLSGRLVTMANPAGGVTTYTYDDAGRQRSARDPLGHETTKAYDGDGNLALETDPLGHQTRYEFDLADRLFRITDAAGGITQFGHDDNGQITSTTNPEGETTTSAYDPAGHLRSVTDALGHPTAYAYDGAGRPTTTTDPLGHATTSVYDPAGRISTRTTASGITTTYTYDPRGMVATVRDALGNEATNTYDDAGRLATARDPRGFTTTYGYDDVGRLTTIKDPKNAVVTLGYDLAGEQTSITDPRGKVWQTAYGPLGGIESTTDPLGRGTVLAYDDAGQLEQKTDARGVVTGYDYDAAGNLVQVTAAPLSISYAYDALNRRTTMSGGLGSTTWSYDRASRITAVAAPAGTVGYSYDDAGRRSAMTLPSGTVGYGYSDDNRLTSLTAPAGGTVGFSYFADGRPQTVTRPNGVTTTDGYDAAGRLTSVTHEKGAATLAAFAYTIDASGNRTSFASAAGTEGYTLNELSQLTKVTLPGGGAIDYAYDAAGNRTSRMAGGTTTTSTYDDASQLTSAGATAYTYDAAGNRLSGGGSTFTWDRLGRLASATSGGSTTTYASDGDGRRVASTTGGSTTPYLWDVAGPLDELVSDGSSMYLHADGLLLSEQSAGSIVYPLADALGSVRAISDATGSVTGTAGYDAFGVRTSQTGASSVFGFTGELTDPAGIYLRARTFDPATGVFLQTDPVRPGAPGVVGYNQYTYVGNNPTTWTDPSGRDYALTLTVSRTLLIAVALTGLALAATVPITRLALCLAAVTCPPIYRPGDSSDNSPTGGGGGGGGGVPTTVPWATGLSDAVAAALAAAGIVAADLVLRDNMPIYRVHGGCSDSGGQSWTPVNPVLIEALGPGTFRQLAGLPTCNTGTELTTGFVDLITFTRGFATAEIAKPLAGNPGGLPEILFVSREDVGANVRNRVTVPVNPPF